MNDQYYMQLAIDIAKSTKGQTTPNPAVGAVIVKNNQVVGIGAHVKAGDSHAEVHAIQMAKGRTKDATMYVTLEPCSHFGKTPPCSKLLIESGIKRVVIATKDPNPKVAGEGIETMKAAGINVEVGLLEKEATQLNQVFFHFIRTGLPFVTLKSATSLDGKTATKTGRSKWITSQEAREDVHYFRHIHDAILVGVNTIIKDNPSLTTRLNGGGKNPVRIILDTHLRTPIDAKVMEQQDEETWIVTSMHVDEKRKVTYQNKGVQIINMQTPTIEIKPMLKLLAEKGICSIFVEGGAEVHGSFLKERAFQQMITYIAPKLIGGKTAPTSFGGEGIKEIEDAMNVDITDVKMIGKDIRITATPM
ncbi:bifunctional diaminohydroxyphosphoribosylaminopyrimidine deaminase/5-amino-6-(5-phosphoribosylamino)uracil reductase RibD [Heyndrickxia sporothermodurans]|uniref:Riboflavin biosynthesis protein RibD n=1 Tax=Heyndrickxia sporothermodurans TaxID=46224 RepID=A0A150KLN9_9BACI|nr:bifunctional diaminohydroxyphosphoribosylaminopyrimidine deaminase/5-amino-6-(5-phosphoribosylamino)uracil reductase RibD [Heyndrickxia sporothermodurans]KYC92494.1 Diaminohydroxyphosphoribosylaminopyrimidine deaminase [Heyndrickxia sporothermodurans]MBL5768290.1 bifunctional diaminohydroxyphosphoribosylaminopyrimidine deaminase/5-amino-6-(5-phosphoribosylamino)uracil reductase RibD [Heyndrickxia sporothermodurans]MBL5771928.1 bifunctional diaminohydroxyphosphoribosylaminopyrimidine deaminase